MSRADDVVRALLAEARDHKRHGRLEEALNHNRRAVALAPDNGLAEHALAATLGDLSHFVEAEAATARALTKGVDAPETWLIRGRALQGLGRLDEAEQAFIAVLARRALDIDGHRDLAQLRWMRNGDLAVAAAMLDQALASAPDAIDLQLLRATLSSCADDHCAAAAQLNRAIARAPEDVRLRLAAANVCARLGDAGTQLAHATIALRAMPSSAVAAKGVVEALLHAGRAEEAAALAERIALIAPLDQGIIALLTTAWQLTGSPRIGEYCDDRLVAETVIDVPFGWRDLPSYLTELAEALRQRHIWRSHPLEQSLRHGSQTQEDLTRADDPAIRALFAALDGPIRQHLTWLGSGGDPIRQRNNGRYRLLGAWSVLLQPGGFHIDHVHPQGWFSSVFYVDLPPAIEREHEGWLAFGRPGIPVSPALKPVRYVRPEPGKLALFPSHFWHGTEPFGGDVPRLTVAFDLVPA